MSRITKWTILAAGFLASCKANGQEMKDYYDLGGGFYWYNSGSPDSHTPVKHLTVLIDGKHVEFAQRVNLQEKPIVADDIIVYCLFQFDSQKPGIYAFKKNRGSRVLVDSDAPIFDLKREVDGVSCNNARTGGRKTISWKEIRARFD